MPRTVVNPLFSSLAPQPQTIPSATQWTTPVSGTGNTDNSQQYTPYSALEVSGSRDVGDSVMNYTTQPYGSPSAPSYASAHASTTTVSGGSPYLQQNQQAQNSYPFTSSLPTQFQRTTQDGATGQPSQYLGSRRHVASLPLDVQSTIHSLDRRYIQTNLNESFAQEQLDASKWEIAQSDRQMLIFLRVSAGGATISCDVLRAWPSKSNGLTNTDTILTVYSQVFKMLWTEPAGQMNPGKTRNSTHFSTVQYGETAFSEIRRFVVVRNKGEFSQCMYVESIDDACPRNALTGLVVLYKLTEVAAPQSLV